LQKLGKNGKTFSNAISESHKNDKRDKAMIWTDAKGGWGKCKKCKKIINVISQKGSCVRDYYTGKWNVWQDEWLYDKSGGGNIHFSSDSFITGDKTMTKYKNPTW